MNVPGHPFPKPPAQVAPYVAVLGPELTVPLLLSFGGAELYVPVTPKGRSRLEQLVGAEKTAALAQATHLMQRRVPLANAWVAACLYFDGWSVSEIVRRIRVTDITVRKYLRRYDMGGGRP